VGHIFLSVGCNGRSAKFWSIISADEFEWESFGFGLEMRMSLKSEVFVSFFFCRR
jgi:hypothetical protein